MSGALRQGLRSTMPSVLGRGGPSVFRTVAAKSALIPRQQLLQSQRRTFLASASLARKQASESSPSVQMSKGVDHANGLVNFRIPQTFVPPDWKLYISQPSNFATLYWAGVKSRFTEFMAEISVRIQSKKGWLGKARFKPNRKALLPLAKNMHYEMLEATASADMTTLRRILTRANLDEVESLIAHRPRGQKCKWELLSYQGRPRVTSHKVVIIPGTNTYVRQAVVTIRSRQRFTWMQAGNDDTPVAKSINNIDTTGKNVRRRVRTVKETGSSAVQKPPTVVEKDVKENVVLMATMDPKSYATSEWRIFGFLPDTTLHGWKKENALMDRAASASKAESKQLKKLKRKEEAAKK